MTDARVRRRDRRNDVIAVMTVLALVALAVWAMLGAAECNPTEIADAAESESTPTVQPEEGDLLPSFRDDPGNLTWRNWAMWATEEWNDGQKGAWKALKEVNQFPTYEQAFNAVLWQVQNEEMGYVYLTSVQAVGGITIVNTGPNGNGYSVGATKLPQGFPYLAWDPRNPHLPTTREITGKDDDAFGIKKNCWNPGRLGSSIPSKRERQDVKGTNPFPDIVGEHQRAVRTPPPTPNYPGRAEEVKDRQDSESPGGLDPTPHGTPGSGTGGGRTTPPAETRNPDGTVVRTPPPPNVPVSPPPPSPDVETALPERN